jgi:oligosaccharide translocation protein RFT1
MSPREQEKILQSTRRGVASLMSSAAIGKLLNFTANVLITRSIGRKVLGTGSLRLDDLLFLGPLVLTREGLRRAAYRSNASNVNTQQSLVNLTWLVAPVTVLFALLFAYGMYIWPPVDITKDDTKDVNVGLAEYHRAMLYTGLAVLLAVLTEPVFVLAQSQLRTGLRAKIEMFAVLGKCLTMLYLTVYLNMSIEAFAIANITYAFIPLCSYWCFFICIEKQFPRPKPLQPQEPGHREEQWCTQEMRSTATVFWWQSLQKWLLENGEKIVLAFVGTTSQQGVYVVVDRLGSIVVRLLFQPAEEMSLATLGKLTALENETEHQEEKKNAATKKQQKQKQKKPKQTTTTNSTTSTITASVHFNFSGWLILLLLVGLTFVCYGPGYVHLFLHVLYGSTWSSTSAPYTLGWYCIYVLFMATNGICEAFVQGTSNAKGIARYNRWMIVFSIVYMCSVMSLLPLFGAVGLILANIIKMLCRIGVCSMSYIRPYFRERGMTQFTLTSLLPHENVLGVFSLSFVVIQCSLFWMYYPAMQAHGAKDMTTKKMCLYVAFHVLVGAVCLSATGWTIWKKHGQHLKNLLGTRQRPKME